jgi:nucleoside-diphosphate-sugar epimerase
MNMNKRIVLVTGAAGLIGHRVRTLLEERGDQVIAVDKWESTVEGRDVTECDLTDVHSLHRLTIRYRPDSIVHCGAISGPMVARDNPHSIFQNNLVGTANILELARVYQIRRVVFCSSVSAYGPTPRGPVAEDVPLNPSTVYGATKAAGEQLIAAYATQHKVDGVSIRLSWVYGPRRQTTCLIRTMLLGALQKRPTRVPSGADFYKQYLYVDDAASSLLLALDATGLQRRTYSVTGDSYLTLGQIADIIRKIIPGADIEVSPGPDPDDDVQEVFDISAARRDLGYAPQFSIEQGIKSYRDWLEANVVHQS